MTNYRRSGTLEWLRERVPAMLEVGGEQQTDFVAHAVEELARAAANERVPEAELRGWHEFLRAVSATMRRRAPEQAARLRSFADELRRDILLASRNPADQLASRPTSRRVLAALLQMGGADCRLADIREVAGQGKTHFSNVLALLKRNGLVTSSGDEADGRRTLLTLTPAGRSAITGALQAASEVHATRIRVDGGRTRSTETFRPSVRQQERTTAPEGAL